MITLPESFLLLLTARLPNAALAALCTSMSGLWSKNRMGSRVSRSTSRTSTDGQVSAICTAFASCVWAQQPRPPLPVNVLMPSKGRASVGLGKLIDVPRSVISANVKLALRWRSMLSEKTSVLRARRGSPEKKSVSPRWREYSQ